MSAIVGFILRCFSGPLQWVLGILTEKLISRIGALIIQAIEDFKRKKKYQEALKKLKEAKTPEEKEKAFEEIMSLRKS